MISNVEDNGVSALPKPKLVHDKQAVANKLEATFIAEVIALTGMSDASSEFGGGIGEEQFQSFLNQQYANLIVEKGGFGLAEHFVKNMDD